MTVALVPRVRLRLGPVDVHAFHLAGGVGLAAGTTLGVAVAAATGRSPLMVLGLAAMSIATLLALAWLAGALLGRDALVAYQHLAGIVAVTASVLLATGQPVAGYLDIVVLGCGAVLAVGRLGCYLVGCCHGRPVRGGARYTAGHALDGFPPSLVGVPLRPLPLYEAAALTALVTVGTKLALTTPPGTAFACFAVGYASVRFLSEPLRGDTRVHAGGLSQAQWASVAVLACAGGWFAGFVWAPLIAAALVLVGRAATRASTVSPAEIDALALALRSLAVGAASPRPAGGLLLSSADIDGADVRLHTLSRPDRPIRPREARRLAEVTLLLAGGDPSRSLRRLTDTGVLHVLTAAR